MALVASANHMPIAIIALSVSSSTLSIIGTLCTIGTFILFRRKGTNVNISFINASKYFVYLSILDFCCAIIYLIPAQQIESLCITQAILVTLFPLCSVLWTACISFYLYIALRFPLFVVNLEIIFHLLCTLYPVAVCIILYFLDAFGSNPYSNWCWIPSNNEYYRLAIGLDYGCVWLSWILSLLFYILIEHHIINKKININDEISQSRIRKLKFIPIVFIIQRIPGSINRILQMLNISCSFCSWLIYAQAFFDPIQGFANFAIYSPVLLKIWRNQCCNKNLERQSLLQQP